MPTGEEPESSAVIGRMAEIEWATLRHPQQRGPGRAILFPGLRACCQDAARNPILIADMSSPASAAARPVRDVGCT